MSVQKLQVHDFKSSFEILQNKLIDYKAYHWILKRRNLE